MATGVTADRHSRFANVLFVFKKNTGTGAMPCVVPTSWSNSSTSFSPIYVTYVGDQSPFAVRFAVEQDPTLRGMVIAPASFRAMACRGTPTIDYHSREEYEKVTNEFASVFRPLSNAKFKHQYFTFFRWWLLGELLKQTPLPFDAWIVNIESDLFLLAPLRPRIDLIRRKTAQGGFVYRTGLLISNKPSLLSFIEFHRNIFLRFDMQDVCEMGKIEPYRAKRRRVVSLPACRMINETHFWRVDDMDVATRFVLMGRKAGWPKWGIMAPRDPTCLDLTHPQHHRWREDGTPVVRRPLCFVHFQGRWKNYTHRWLRSRSRSRSHSLHVIGQ